MKLTEILNVLEEVAPVALSDEFCRKYKMYDNSGIIFDSGEEIVGAVFSLDLSTKVINKAIKKGCNLIVTHHPAIYGGVTRLNYKDPVAKCIKNGISIISMHLNFDAAPEGIDYWLMRGLGGEKARILADVTDGGYGRVYSVAPAKFNDYLSNVQATFSNRAVGFGSDSKSVKRVASFCGAGCDNSAMAFALNNGADVFVSSDLKEHEIAYLLERGINVIHLTHYSAEDYGFNKIYGTIKNKLQIPTDYFRDEDLA